jgi:hypothetical protein
MDDRWNGAALLFQPAAWKFQCHGGQSFRLYFNHTGFGDGDGVQWFFDRGGFWRSTIHPDADGDGITHGDCVSYADEYANEHRHADGIADRDTDSRGDRHADQYGYIYGDGVTYGNGVTYADEYPNHRRALRPGLQ